jgi:hypothetical protein
MQCSTIEHSPRPALGASGGAEAATQLMITPYDADLLPEASLRAV